ncbi:twin transmembrane helix small protein [Aureimonas psammosilenae]|uniref:twin transmembrane helix small protein n=1 Tax=Aureimonas psammosilenae TaxID=2495496 RepID=UPI001260E012|nr:twin transmembrane helix small protein [Aureimonas psammosilenae]
MSGFMSFLALALMAAVAAVLLAGLLNMMRNGPGNTSQRLMRARVLLQGLAILAIVIAILIARSNGS